MLTTVQARKQAYGMGDPPLLREEDGTTDAFVEGLEVTQHSYRMHKTVFGPMTSIEAVCHDDWSGEVFEWRWKDDLNPEFLADSMPSVAEVRLSVNSFVNGLERQSTEPETTFSAQRVALWTYEALGRQPPEALLRIADAPAEAQALGRLFVFTCRVRAPPPIRARRPHQGRRRLGDRRGDELRRGPPDNCRRAGRRGPGVFSRGSGAYQLSPGPRVALSPDEWRAAHFPLPPRSCERGGRARAQHEQHVGGRRRGYP